jgi:hypothetical protein
VKSPTDENTAYLPDVMLVDRRELASEPYWEKASTLTRGSSIPVIVEVVSTNWRDDYLKGTSKNSIIVSQHEIMVDGKAFWESSSWDKRDSGI